MKHTDAERAHPAFDWAVNEAIGIACETVRGYDAKRAAWVLKNGAELAGQQHELEILIARGLTAAYDRGGGSKLDKLVLRLHDACRRTLLAPNGPQIDGWTQVPAVCPECNAKIAQVARILVAIEGAGIVTPAPVGGSTG